MEIKNFIKIYDEVLPWNVLSNLIRYANYSEFHEAKIGGGEKAKVDFNIRRTYAKYLSNLDTSLTNVHWFNLLYSNFDRLLKKYCEDFKMRTSYSDIIDIEILKYEDTGFYTWHVDHFSKNPRTMSCILLLNNDYEGGNLCFKNPDGSGEFQLDVVPNRMIIWPSNFLYPHMIKPITKGKRYSVVAWAL